MVGCIRKVGERWVRGRKTDVREGRIWKDRS
jgi:hypothetical protein